MKAAYICRACQRNLKATYNASSTSTSSSTSTLLHLSQPPLLRSYTTSDRFMIHGSPNGNAKLDEIGVPDPERLLDIHTPHTSPSQKDMSIELITARRGVVRALDRESTQKTQPLVPSTLPPSPGPLNRPTPKRPADRPAGRSHKSQRNKKQHQTGSRKATNTIGLKRSDPVKKKSGAWLRGPDYAQRIQKKGLRWRFQWVKTRNMMVTDESVHDVRKAFIRWNTRCKLLNSWKKVKPNRKWLQDGRWIWRLGSLDSMQHAWEELPVDQRRHLWPGLMISTLISRRNLAQRVLLATLDPLPPVYALSDTLLAIAKFLPRKETLSKGPYYRLAAEEVVQLVARLIDLTHGNPHHLPLYQRTLGIMASRLPQDCVHRLYEVLKLSSMKLHPNTLLQFASKLAGGVSLSHQAEYKKSALEILEILATEGSNLKTPINTLVVLSIVTRLLHYKSSDADEEIFDPKDALARLWDKGFRPNIINLTAFLDSACLSGDVGYAIHMANLFVDQGLRFDGRALDILFRGAKHSMKSDHVRDLLQFSQKCGLSAVNTSLHSIFYFAQHELRQKKGPGNALRPFLPMLSVYKKMSPLAALQSLIPDSLPLLLAQHNASMSALESDSEHDQTWDIERGIVPVVDEFVSALKFSKKTNWKALATMFRAYIRSLGTPYELIMLWIYFKSRLQGQQGPHNIANGLVKHERALIHDTFIYAMLLQQGLTRPALEIFGDMVKDNLRENDNPLHPPPTVFTFAILLNGLAMNGEANLTEQIYQVMKEHKIQPNIVALNTRIKGAALAQNVNKIVLGLQELEAASFEANEFTLKAFGRLHNQESVLKKMQKIIDENERNLEGGWIAKGALGGTVA